MEQLKEEIALKDMMRMMMSRCNLPMSLWGEAIKTAMYILNRVSNKSIPLTPFELQVGRKPSLNHFGIWGCIAEVRIYNPFESKLDPKTTRCFFVGYLNNSKGYNFIAQVKAQRLQILSLQNFWRMM